MNTAKTNSNNMNYDNVSIDFNRVIYKLIANKNWDSSKPILTSEEAQKLYCDNTYSVLHEICCTYLNENTKWYIYNFEREDFEVSSYITDQNIFTPRDNIYHTRINDLKKCSYIRSIPGKWYIYTIEPIYCYLELFDHKCQILAIFYLYKIEDLNSNNIDFLVLEDRIKIESILCVMQMH